MTNQIAVGLAILILGLLGLDFGVNEGNGTLFLGRKFLDVLYWVAFWR